MTHLSNKHIALIMLLAVFNGKVIAHAGHTQNEAIKACQEKLKSDDCSYGVAHQGLSIGTCQQVSEIKMCVRNKPIVKWVTPKEADNIQTDRAEAHLKRLVRENVD